MSSVAARFFTPQIAGAGANPVEPDRLFPFRIDHDEHFNLTTHLQYEPRKNWPWVGFTWRYDSGLVAGATSLFRDWKLTNNWPASILIVAWGECELCGQQRGIDLPCAQIKNSKPDCFWQRCAAPPTAQPLEPLPFNMSGGDVRVERSKSTGAKQRG